MKQLPIACFSGKGLSDYDFTIGTTLGKVVNLELPYLLRIFIIVYLPVIQKNSKGEDAGFDLKLSTTEGAGWEQMELLFRPI